jgi:hypothetical protein
MHLTYFVGQTGIKKHTLGGGSFTSINMGTDTNIAIATNGCFTGHNFSSKTVCF